MHNATGDITVAGTWHRWHAISIPVAPGPRPTPHRQHDVVDLAPG